jgi:hypothetical protein
MTLWAKLMPEPAKPAHAKRVSFTTIIITSTRIGANPRPTPLDVHGQLDVQRGVNRGARSLDPGIVQEWNPHIDLMTHAREMKTSTQPHDITPVCQLDVEHPNVSFSKMHVISTHEPISERGDQRNEAPPGRTCKQWLQRSQWSSMAPTQRPS